MLQLILEYIERTFKNTPGRKYKNIVAARSNIAGNSVLKIETSPPLLFLTLSAVYQIQRKFGKWLAFVPP